MKGFSWDGCTDGSKAAGAMEAHFPDCKEEAV